MAGVNRKFLSLALDLARQAGAAGEIPVGAVVVRDGVVLGRGKNMREAKNSVCSHAEIEAMNEACQALGDWRLDGCTLYVTLEPCAMCAGAILNARVETVVFGAYDLRAGALGSVTDLSTAPFDFHPTVYGGIMEDECAAVLTDFFRAVRHERENS